MLYTVPYTFADVVAKRLYEGFNRSLNTYTFFYASNGFSYTILSIAQIR